MVDVIQTERLLSYLEREWNSVPVIVRKWPEMDAIDQEILQLEWVLREQALDQLEIDVLAEGLAPQQKCRYRALLQLIEEMRPIYADSSSRTSKQPSAFVQHLYQ